MTPGESAPPAEDEIDEIFSAADLFHRLVRVRGVRSWHAVMEEAGVPIHALRRLSYSGRPEPEHVAALENWLAGQTEREANDA